ncbi:unnamed protein product [Withania somnifera]
MVSKWFKNAPYLAIKARKQAESAKPCQVTSPKTSVGCIPETVKGELADQISSSDAEKNASQAPKNLGRSPNEAAPNLVIHPSKKKYHKKSSKTINKLSRAKKERRKLNSKERKKIQEAAAEMQKLCRIKDKVARLQDVLPRFTNRRGRRADASSLDESLVVFIHVAELQEKR